MNSQPPAKGSLEELFRHHLLESEAAAVPPRPLVWEQLDNSLLVSQNEKYRRRLLVHRWAVAASLLLAMLASGGWWHSQQATTASLATANPQGRPTPPAGASVASYGSAVNARLSHITSTNEEDAPSVAAASSTAAAAQRQVASAGSARANAGLLPVSQVVAYERSASNQRTQALPWSASVARSTSGQAVGKGVAVASQRLAIEAGQTPNEGTGIALTSPTRRTAAAYPSLNPALPIATTATSPLPAAAFRTLALAPELGAGSAGEALLASRVVSLPAGALAALPTTLALTDEPPRPATKLRRWQFGAAYAATAFQPNIDFNSAAPTYYNAASSYNTVASSTRAAAAEYRANLRAGLGQRLSLRATRWLGGHWSLSTGLEAAQQEATSATTTDFVGGSAGTPTAATTAPRVLRASSYRYRSAGIPVELHYGNPVKTGLSLYGRVGALVSALLSVRSEVAGSPEATRTYSLASAGSPYRHVSATVRGAAGVQYRPARHGWALNLGPVAEAGVQSLNADPGQSFWSQQRPYSIGLEAGVELGGGLKVQ